MAVHLDGAGRIAEWVAAPVPRRLARLRGTLEELLADPRHAAAEEAWVQAVLTYAVRPTGAMERLRARFPHALVLGFEPSGAGRPDLPTAAPTGRSDHEVALAFVGEMRGADATEAERLLLRDAVEACCEDRDLDPTPSPSSPSSPADGEVA